MEGRSQADKVYIWNYAKGSWNNGSGDEFTMMAGTRITDVMLAFADDPIDNRNYINLVSTDGQFFTGTDTITTIFLESHLTPDSKFDPNATIAGDWLAKYLIKNNGSPIPSAAALIKRFAMGNFTYGLTPSIPLSGYTLDNTGKLIR
jgi:hypothetical protein